MKSRSSVMPVITRELLRKRAEHNEGILSTLEEVSLHQEELENINEVLGTTCRRLKILYLQNNLIPKMENLQHLKELEYLNLALNNIQKIEGLQNCEFLHKLDLTINFIDLDWLEESIDHLVSRQGLRELYMMGNPCQAHWEGFNFYVIAKLPQLRTLDGTEITKSMQILANQRLPSLEEELRDLAEGKRKEKSEKKIEMCLKDGDVEEVYSSSVNKTDTFDPNELTDNTPEARVKVSKRPYSFIPVILRHIRSTASWRSRRGRRLRGKSPNDLGKETTMRSMRIPWRRQGPRRRRSMRGTLPK